MACPACNLTYNETRITDSTGQLLQILWISNFLLVCCNVVVFLNLCSFFVVFVLILFSSFIKSVPMPEIKHANNSDFIRILNQQTLYFQPTIVQIKIKLSVAEEKWKLEFRIVVLTFTFVICKKKTNFVKKLLKVRFWKRGNYSKFKLDKKYSYIFSKLLYFLFLGYHFIFDVGKSMNGKLNFVVSTLTKTISNIAMH